MPQSRFGVFQSWMLDTDLKTQATLNVFTAVRLYTDPFCLNQEMVTGELQL